MVSNSATIAIGEGFYLSGLGLCCPFYARAAQETLVRDQYGQYGYSRCGDRRTLDGVCCHRCGPSNVTGQRQTPRIGLTFTHVGIGLLNQPAVWVSTDWE